MKNKYNLDYYETMEVANGYLDLLEDEMQMTKETFKKDPERLAKELENMKENYEPIAHLEDLLNIYLEDGDYQSVANQLVLIEMTYIFVRDVLPDTDLGYISDYLESISEIYLVEDVTRIIDDYKMEVK